MANTTKYNWKLCLEIDPDKDFWYQKVIPELDGYDTSIIIDATPENAELMLEQFRVFQETVDAKEYLKGDTEQRFRDIVAAFERMLTKLLEHMHAYDEWIDVSIDEPCGNQHFAFAVLPDYMTNPYEKSWAESPLSNFYIGGDAVEFASIAVDTINEFEAHGAGDIYAGEYEPPAA